MKKKLLFMVQLPPPVHGAALRNKTLVESQMLNHAFNIRCLPLDFSDSHMDLGKTSIKKIVKMVLFFFKLLVTLVQFRPNCAYMTLSPVGGAFLRDCMFIALVKLMRIPIIHHLRGKGVYQAANSWKYFLYHFALKNTKVICLSEFLTKDIVNVYDGTPVVVHNGIETHVSDQQVKSKQQRRGPKTILYLSNLIKTKGVLDAIKAVAKLSVEDFVLKIAGSERDVSYEQCKDLARQHSVADKIEIVGPVYGDEKFQLFLSADIFLFPTYYPKEAFPGVVLEAMQCGAVVVAYDEAAIPEILNQGEFGKVVHSRNIEGLSIALDELLQNDTLRLGLASGARKRFMAMYTNKVFEKNMKDAFNRLLT